MTATRTDPDFRAQLAGFSLTTAEILYRLPDHPSLLQSYIWQDYDMHPRFPRLRTFLDFWTRNLDGKLFGVRVAHKKLITPAELRSRGRRVPRALSLLPVRRVARREFGLSPGSAIDARCSWHGPSRSTARH